jgi:hypothetical protein
VYWGQLLMKMAAANLMRVNHVCGAFVLLCEGFQQSCVIVADASRICKRIVELLQLEQHILKGGPIRLPVRAARLHCISALDTSCQATATCINSTYSTGASLVKSPVRWSHVLHDTVCHVPQCALCNTLSHPAASAAAPVCAAACR